MAQVPTHLSPTEIAEEFPDLSAEQIRRWARQGRIAVVKLPSGRMMFRREDIERLFVPTGGVQSEAS